jgi:GT2 family glycosyltransferase
LNSIAVVILNYNGEKLLQQFLPSVIQYSQGASIVVADNGSTDQSVEILKKDFPSVQLILLDKNYGFCGGYHRALKQIEAEYYVLLNSDVEVTPNWLKPMLELVSSDTSIAAIQPKILSYHQRDHFEYAGAGGGFIDTLGYPFCRGRLFDVTETDSGQYNDTREIFWASGACMFVRSSVYHELDGLDEDFFAHMEEIDLCWRIQRKGFRIFYTGQSHVFHVGAGTLSRSNPRKTYFNFRNGLTLLLKNWPTAELIFKLPVRIVLDYVAALKFILEGNFRHGLEVLRAHIDCFRRLGNTLKKRAQLARKYPFSNKNTYKGIIALEHFVLRKKRIKLD